MAFGDLVRTHTGKILTKGGKWLTSHNYAPDPNPDYCYCCTCDPAPSVCGFGPPQCRVPRYTTVTCAGCTMASGCIFDFPDFVPLNTGPSVHCDASSVSKGISLKILTAVSCDFSVTPRIVGDPGYDGNNTLIQCGYGGLVSAGLVLNTSHWCDCPDFPTAASNVWWDVFYDPATAAWYALIYNFSLDFNAIPESGGDGDEDDSLIGSAFGAGVTVFFYGKTPAPCTPWHQTGSASPTTITISNVASIGTTIDPPAAFGPFGTNVTAQEFFFMGSGGTITITCDKIKPT